MKITNQYIIFILAITATLTACSKQNWYHGAQSAQTAHCMKQPLAEYNDCNEQSRATSYQDYEKDREQLQNQKGSKDY